MRHLTQMMSMIAFWLAVAAIAHAQSAALVASGNQTLASAIEALDWHVSIAARIRYQSRLDKHTLMGSGEYWQLGSGEQRRTRWEMKTQIADNTVSFVQVFDGEYLYTDRGLPSGREVHRLDVKLLQSRLGNESLTSENDLPNSLSSLQARGGLMQMLADLMQRYEFAPPRQTQLNGLAVYALIGRWRHEQLASLGVDMPPMADIEANWPSQVPHHVLLLLGKERLFPYVIEFRRASDRHLLETVAGLRPTRDPLVRYEIFEVQSAKVIDLTKFKYKPGDVKMTDETLLVIKRLRKQQKIIAERMAGKVVAEGVR